MTVKRSFKQKPFSFRKRGFFLSLELLVIIILIAVIVMAVIVGVKKIYINYKALRVVKEYSLYGEALLKFKSSYGQYPGNLSLNDVKKIPEFKSDCMYEWMQKDPNLMDQNYAVGFKDKAKIGFRQMVLAGLLPQGLINLDASITLLGNSAAIPTNIMDNGSATVSYGYINDYLTGDMTVSDGATLTGYLRDVTKQYSATPFACYRPTSGARAVTIAGNLIPYSQSFPSGLVFYSINWKNTTKMNQYFSYSDNLLSKQDQNQNINLSFGSVADDPNRLNLYNGVPRIVFFRPTLTYISASQSGIDTSTNLADKAINVFSPMTTKSGLVPSNIAKIVDAKVDDGKPLSKNSLVIAENAGNFNYVGTIGGGTTANVAVPREGNCNNINKNNKLSSIASGLGVTTYGGTTLTVATNDCPAGYGTSPNCTATLTNDNYPSMEHLEAAQYTDSESEAGTDACVLTIFIGSD